MLEPLRPGELILADGLPTPQELVESLRHGHAHDSAFDRFLPEPWQAVSRHFWTPLAVAKRAAGWLDEQGATRVLDIGSGSGKFCVAAALTGSARYVGLEHRPHLVAAARDLARVFRVEDRVTFIHGALGDVALPAVDAYYLFNPFGENLYTESSCLDQDVELTVERYGRDIAAVELLLQQAPLGTCLVTYNGFGGQVPSTYDELDVDRESPTPLCLWRKVRRDVVGRVESRFMRPALLGVR